MRICPVNPRHLKVHRYIVHIVFQTIHTTDIVPKVLFVTSVTTYQGHIFILDVSPVTAV